MKLKIGDIVKFTGYKEPAGKPWRVVEGLGEIVAFGNFFCVVQFPQFGRLYALEAELELVERAA